MAANKFGVGVGVNIDDSMHVFYGSADPSAGGGVAAPVGSLYGRTTNGEIWHKTGAPDTSWAMLLDSAGSSVEDGYQNAFMGKGATGNEMPNYSSNNVVTDSTSLESAIGDLDAEIGPAVVPVSRTYSPTLDQDVNSNIEALDAAIGTDTEHSNTNYTTVNASLKTNVSELDAAIAAKEPIKLSATNQDASLGLTLDSVAIASKCAAEWLLCVKSNTTPANRQSWKVVALNDGTSSVDWNRFAINKVGSNISGISIDVDISAGNMRLRVTASENIDYSLSRISV